MSLSLIMKHLYSILIVWIFASSFLKAQAPYYPPLTGSVWDTIAPQSMGWCQARIDSLYNYLLVKNSKSFILLKDGKIVLEKYFGSYTRDSIFYWASASKSLASFITGIAQEKGLININTKVSQYIGNGWTSAPQAKEDLIKVSHLLKMTSGLDDGPPLPCDNEDTAKTCLIYKVDAGNRWAYHTGAYKKVQDVVSAAAGQNYNLVTNNWVELKTGMSGFWFDQTYYSKARDMARFGLLNLRKGIWATDTLLKDSLYLKAMISTSQSFNEAYGYLWWLNGKSSFMNPGLQLVLNGPLIPNAPSDLYAALGKNDQKIYVSPSTGMVVVRQGNSAEGVTFALSNFDNKLWDYINKLNCNLVSVAEEEVFSENTLIYPNPATDFVSLEFGSSVKSVSITSVSGQAFQRECKDGKIDVSDLNKGLYFLTITSSKGTSLTKKLVIN